MTPSRRERIGAGLLLALVTTCLWTGALPTAQSDPGPRYLSATSVAAMPPTPEPWPPSPFPLPPPPCPKPDPKPSPKPR